MPGYRVFLSICVIALMSTLASAATDTETITINATFGDHAKLTIVPTTINFPDADPDAVDPIPALENSVSVESKVRASDLGVSTLTCLADGDLISGTDVIAISNVTWTSTGAGYVDGTMDDAVDQSAGSWTGPGAFAGTFDYFLDNSWDYATGIYSQTVVYTLATP